MSQMYLNSADPNSNKNYAHLFHLCKTLCVGTDISILVGIQVLKTSPDKQQTLTETFCGGSHKDSKLNK